MYSSWMLQVESYLHQYLCTYSQSSLEIDVLKNNSTDFILILVDVYTVREFSDKVIIRSKQYYLVVVF